MAYLRWSTEWMVKPLSGNCQCPYYLFWNSRESKGCKREGQVLTAMILNRETEMADDGEEYHFDYGAVKREREGVLQLMGVAHEEFELVNEALDKFVANIEEKFNL